MAEMLAVARALFVQLWWRYEFQVVAVLWSLMAVEAALRRRLPSESARTTLAKSLERARKAGALSDEELAILDAGRRLRNNLVHATGQTNLSPGATAPMLETAHLLTNRLCSDPPATQTHDHGLSTP